MKLDGMSMDLERANLEKLAAVFPEVMVEVRLDFDKLCDLLGKYEVRDFEKYKFEWKGKSECLQLAQRRSTGTLRPVPGESVDFDTTQNLYIEGDNLEVLKLLQTAYYRRVKMIYIDPPYNTGNDFVYADDYADPLARYREVTQQTTKSNPESMGRFHTNWLNMMYPRLRLAANLLRDDGVIFISIDDNEVHNLRKLCDEVFGEENFVGQLVWERAYSPVNLKKHFSPNHDFVLCYAKRFEQLVCNGLTRSDDANDRYKNPDNDSRGVWKSADLSVGPAVAEKVYEITTPTGRKVLPPDGRCWVYTKERFEEMLADNRIWFGETGNNVPSVKKFLSEVKNTITPMTIWKYTEVGHSQDAAKGLKALFDGSDYFDYPKPVGLIKRMLELYTNSDTNDIILDFFSGSATTAHAVMQLNAEDGGNRRFIMVQLPEMTDEKSEAYKAGYHNICEIGKERIRRAGAKLKKMLRENGSDMKRMREHQFVMQDVTIRNPEDTSDDPNVIVGGKTYKNAIAKNPLAYWVPGDEDEINEKLAQALDTGFRVFKLDSSSLTEWDSSHVREENLHTLYDRLNGMVESVKHDRTDLDVVYEVMLKLGVPLSAAVEPVEIRGKTCYSIGEDTKLLVCLAANITAEDVEAMAARAPAKLILAESGLADDSAVSNAHYILRDRGIELKLV